MSVVAQNAVASIYFAVSAVVGGAVDANAVITGMILQ